MKKLGLLGSVVLVVMVLMGCGKTIAVKGVQESGFLGDDYALLERPKGMDYAPYLMYIKEDVDWTSYTKVLLDPVVIWRAEDSKIEVSMADIQTVANNFYILLYKELSKDYEMVDVPSPGTLRLQVALTEVQTGGGVMSTITSVIPVSRVVGDMQGYTYSSKPMFAGAISVESRNTDAMTGQLIAAAMDRRVGSKNIYKSWETWADINDALEYWAGLQRYHMCLNRGEADCAKPTMTKGF